MYCDGVYSSIDPGQIYYVNLNIFMRAYSLATAFEVLKVDNERKLFEFSYVNGS